jgi:hypothetical protein
MYKVTIRNRKKGIFENAEVETMEDVIYFLNLYDLRGYEIFVVRDV